MNGNIVPTTPGTTGDYQVVYDIRAPHGGLQRQIDMFLSPDEATRTDFIDMTISPGTSHKHTVRVFPDRGTCSWDDARPTLFHFRGGECVELVDNVVTGPLRDCSGWVNVQVTHEPLPTGKLRILYANKEETP